MGARALAAAGDVAGARVAEASAERALRSLEAQLPTERRGTFLGAVDEEGAR
jgi:hypothetical protein